MKNGLLRLIMAAGLVSVSLFSSLAIADLGMINLTMTGVILTETCDIDASSKNQTVNIGSFSAGDFKNTGDVSASKAFNILMKNCTENIKSANITFTGSTGSDPTVLNLSDALGTGNMAKGIGVQVLGENNQPLVINSQTPQKYSLKQGSNTLNFFLRYKSTQPTVTPGNASAVLYFTMDYE